MPLVYDGREIQAESEKASPVNMDQALAAYVEGSLTVGELIGFITSSNLDKESCEALLRALPVDAFVALIRTLPGTTEPEEGYALAASYSGSATLLASPAHSATTVLLQDGLNSSLRPFVDDVDFPQAVVNTRSDAFADWYRDPWGWPELDFLLDHGREYLSARLAKGPSGHAEAFDVPKSFTSNRPALLLDLTDRVIFQAAADSVTPRLNEAQPGWVYGWRLPPKGTAAGHYARLDYQWENYSKNLGRAGDRFNIAFRADIDNSFASINLDVIEASLSAFASPSTASLILRTVARVSAATGQPGLPQRAAASSVIAHLVLAKLDSALQDQSLSLASIVHPVRWMDDYWAFAKTESIASALADTLTEALTSIGLAWNASKTAIFEGSALRAQIDRIGVGYIDGALRGSSQGRGFAVLAEAMHKLIAEPALAERHEISYIVSRIKQKDASDLATEIAESAGKLGHGADYIAPMIKKFGLHRDYLEWLSRLVTGDAPGWVKSTYFRMWPINEVPKTTFVTELAELATSGDAPPILRAAIVSRLSVWDKKTVRDLFESCRQSTLTPFIRRAVGLAAFAAGEKRARVVRFLLEDETTAIVAGLLNNGMTSDALGVVV